MLPRETAARAAALELRRADLLSRREDLLGRLTQRELEPADRRRLQVSTARVLKELDEVEEVLATVAPSGGLRKAAAPVGRAFVQAHPLLSGVLLGGGVVGLVAALVIWAQTDARPDPEGQQMADQQTADGADFRGQAPLGPEVARQAEKLQRQIEADPTNIDLHRALTQLLLMNGRQFDAFQQAQRILEIDPEDPDGHYVSGIVRLRMGQTDIALNALSQSLRSDPGHEQAAMMRGLLLMQLGDRDGATATWESANEARASTRLQQLIAMAREGKTFQEIVNNPL